MYVFFVFVIKMNKYFNISLKKVISLCSMVKSIVQNTRESGLHILDHIEVLDKSRTSNIWSRICNDPLSTLVMKYTILIVYNVLHM